MVTINRHVLRTAIGCLAVSGVLVLAGVGNAHDRGASTGSLVLFDDSDCLGTALDVVSSMEDAKEHRRARSVKRIGSSECVALTPTRESLEESPDLESSPPAEG